MRETVFNYMLEVYNLRINIFRDEDIEIFTQILTKCKYRRCIHEELISIEEK